MPEIIDHVAYLSQEIGPRPAGTEEEQQAALYITEQFQKEAGFSAVIEDFNGAADSDGARMLCCGITFIVSLLALFLPVLRIPAALVCILALVLFAAELVDRPVLSKMLARGVSQNVVAKYEPAYSETAGTRRRKIVLMAHYDSGKVRAELNTPFIKALPFLRDGIFAAMVVLPLILIVRIVVFIEASSPLALFLTFISALALVLTALPLVGGILRKMASYNEAANCNASGVALLLELAQRVAQGRDQGPGDLTHDEVALHGEQAARAQNLVPEGAEFVYAASQLQAPEPTAQSEAARLAAAKAAVAALTGMPVSDTKPVVDIAENLVQVKEAPLSAPSEQEFQAQRDQTREAFTTIPPETVQAALANAQAAVEEDGGMDSQALSVEFGAASPLKTVNTFHDAAEQEPGIPDWFKRAQQKAKKPLAAKKTPVRSRYAEALDAALADEKEAQRSSLDASALDQEKPTRSEDEDLSKLTAEPSSNSSQQEQIKSQAAPKTSDIVSEPVSEQQAEESVETSSRDHAANEALANVEELLSTNKPSARQAVAGATCAMPALDVSDLRPSALENLQDVPLPAFLNPHKTQAEALEQRGQINRTSNRVDVTAAPIGDSGRLEYLPPSEDELHQEKTEVAASSSTPSTPSRAPIVLPDISSRTPMADLPKQRAPLAEAQDSGKSAAKSLLSMLPSIEPDQNQGVPATSGASEGGGERGGRSTLRASLPSLSGSIRRQDDGAVSAAGSFAPAGATGTFAPVGDELLENVAPEDIYVDDADDSAYEEDFTETGAFAGAGYVDMPKSRRRRFFDKLRFGKHKKAEEPSPQEWLDVDESFDPRAAGAKRGGWESFRQQEGEAELIDEYQSHEQVYEHQSGSGFYEQGEYYEEDQISPSEATPFQRDISSKARHHWEGGGFSREHMEHNGQATPVDDESQEAASNGQASLPGELESIYKFSNPPLNTEVWFVALGSQLAEHGGMRAFLAEHGQDLRGSIIIELSGMGAGTLSMIQREGMYRKVTTSSRMKRYLKKASEACGMRVESDEILWAESAASLAIKQGFQAMHLAGMKGSKPAYFAQGDDVLENIDEKTLSDNAVFVMELLKNI